MPTANTIIADALGCIGVVDPTDAVNSEDADLGLRILNRVADALGVQNLMTLAVVNQTVSLSAGVASRTIGLLGDVAVARPARFETGAYVRYDGIDTPLHELTRQQYASISDKDATGTPRAFYYEPTTSALGTIYFYPVPTVGVTCYMPIQTRLSQFTDLTTSYGLADGYEDFLVNESAIKLAPFYNREAPSSVVLAARAAKRAIKRLNAQVPQLSTAEVNALAHPGSVSTADLLSGELDIY